MYYTMVNKNLINDLLNRNSPYLNVIAFLLILSFHSCHPYLMLIIYPSLILKYSFESQLQLLSNSCLSFECIKPNIRGISGKYID